MKVYKLAHRVPCPVLRQGPRWQQKIRLKKERTNIGRTSDEHQTNFQLRRHFTVLVHVAKKEGRGKET